MDGHSSFFVIVLCTVPPPLSPPGKQEKRRLCLNRVKSLKTPQSELLDFSTLFSRQTGFSESQHPFLGNPMFITKPAVPSARLLGLGSKLYSSKIQRKLNKDSSGVFLDYEREALLVERVVYTKQLKFYGFVVIDDELSYCSLNSPPFALVTFYRPL